MQFLIVILISLAIIVPIVIVAQKKHEQLVAEGSIVERKIDFVEKAEIYTIKKLEDFSPVTNGVMNFNYGDIRCTLDGDKAKQTYHFKGGDWSADLWLVGNSETETVYRFEFANWSERRGIPYSAVNMNKLETAVEKLFMSIDPNAMVRAEKIEYKTNHSFI